MLQRQRFANYNLEDGLVSSSVFGASDTERQQVEKLRNFLAKLNPVCQTNFVKNWMDLACCGEAALAVYTDVKAALEQRIPLSRLEEALGASQAAASGGGELVDALRCTCCSGLIMEPVCFPCGHSTCKTCIDKLPAPPLVPGQQGRTVECPQCKQAWSPYQKRDCERKRNPTVLLTSLWSKHLSSQCRAAGLKENGNKFATEGDYLRAVENYSESLVADPLDHRVLSNRSRALLVMGRTGEALRDAEECCSLKPLWPKGHFRRGAALEKLGQQVEAVSGYLLCLHLGGCDRSIYKNMCQLLNGLLGDDSSSLWQRKHHSDCAKERQKLLVGNLVYTSVHTLEKFITICNSRTPMLKQVVSQLTVEEGELDCVLCANILLNPVTTCCGHTFCRDCLCRNFDHTPNCPVCRTSLAELFKLQLCGRMVSDSLAHSLIVLYCPAAYEAKRVAHEVEQISRNQIGINDEMELPIFACMMAYPHLPCPLHIFEPRYRMLIRRCVESSKRFGMCSLLEPDGTFQQCGTIVHIQSVEYTPDGRSLITTVGERRFRVLDHRKEDGLTLARIKFVEDEVIRPEEADQIQSLQEEVYQLAQLWFAALPPLIKVCVMQSVCSPVPEPSLGSPLPQDGPTWLWWFVSALPIGEDRKVQFLLSTSLRERLLLLRGSLPLPGRSLNVPQ